MPCTEEYFYKNPKNKQDGLYPECKECSVKKSAISQNIRRVQVSKYNHNRYMNDREGFLEARKLHYQNNKEKRYRYTREYRQKPDIKQKLNEYGKRKRIEKTHNISDEEWTNCKNYFNNSCAYCGLSSNEHFVRRNKQLILMDLHKEHVIHNGKNNLSNCIPSCQSCNSIKRENSLNNWYNKDNHNYTYERYHKIYLWLRYDYKKSRSR